MTRKRRDKGKIDFKADIRDVDVVIPVFSNFEVVEKAIEALNANTKNVKFQIFLVDDCSPDYHPNGSGFYERAKLMPNVTRIVRHTANLGFPQTVNDGAKLGNSKYILILNSDVILQSEALEILFIQLEANADIGITAPKLLFFPNSADPARPAGRVQHAGVVFDIQSRPYHIYNGWNSEHPMVNVVRDMNCATGACLLIRRKLFEELGGFDPVYERGTWEDIELCLRVRMLNYKIRYLPQAVGYHFTGLSAEKSGGFPLNRNASIFKARWGDNIPYDEWIFSGR